MPGSKVIFDEANLRQLQRLHDVVPHMPIEAVEWHLEWVKGTKGNHPEWSAEYDLEYWEGQIWR